MSYFGHGQNGVQHPQSQQIIRQAGTPGSTGVLPSQIFSQLQFAQSGNTNTLSFPDPNSSNHIQILHQQPQQPTFQNINFLTEQLTAGVGQIISQAQNQSQAISMQNLLNPMTMTNLTSVGYAPALQVTQSASTQQSSQGQQQKQRVFTGTVTKTHDNFGFIDEEVFFQMGAVKGPILPKAGDRVLVEADYNSANPFKWNATRVQIVNIGGGITSMSSALNPGGKSQSPQPAQHLQHMHQTFQLQNQQVMEKRPQGLVAPPPPILSGNSSRQTSQSSIGSGTNTGSNYSQVSIISNPHSIYSQGTQPPVGMVGSAETSRGIAISTFHQSTRTPNRGRVNQSVQQMQIPQTSESLMSHPTQFQGNQGIPPLFQQSGNSDVEIIRNVELDAKKDRERDRDRSRDEERERDREREREKERERDRSKREREREKERERERDREREKERDRDREKERDRDRDKDREREKRKRSPAPSAKSRDDLRRDLTKDKDKEKIRRNRSPSLSLSRKRSRSRERDRKPVKESNDNEKTAAKPKSKSPSPKRKVRPTPRYSIELPKHSLDTLQMNAMELKKRYPELYVPSDFFLAKASWTESFSMDKPMDLTKSTPIHVFRKHVDKIDIGTFERGNEHESPLLKVVKAVENVEPLDASHVFNAKVILVTLPGKSIYHKTCTLAENSTDVSEPPQHLNRIINFIVGSKTGKTETMLIGGQWSALLDGQNPHSDPQVLVNTAIRTCKSLTGIDLKRCTKWYRFMELHYRRSNGNLETMVIFFPDISMCLPSNNEWLDIVQTYKVALHGQDKSSQSLEKEPIPGTIQESEPVSSEEESMPTAVETVVPELPSSSNKILSEVTIKEEKLDDDTKMDAEDLGTLGNTGLTGTVIKMEVDSEVRKEMEMEELENSDASKTKGESPKKSSQETPDKQGLLDPNKMNVVKLREELALRGLNTKGLKPQLISRLVKALHDEQESEASMGSSDAVVDLGSIVHESSDLVIHITESDADTQRNDDQPQNSPKKETIVSENNETNLEMNESVSETNSTTTVEIKDQNEKEKDTITDMVIVESSSAVFKMAVPSAGLESKGHPELKAEAYKPQVIPGILVPILTDEMDERTRKIWERRYVLPKKPNLLLHPSKTAKDGDFDCVQMTLASLRDYRASDIKEPAFEVSLCAEFFHEMLQRNFAFRIYCEILARGSKVESGSPKQVQEDKMKKSEEKKIVCTSPENKKRKLSSASSTGTLQKGADPPKLKTINPHLLLCFSFFDPTRCGYLTENDLEELCLALGLGMSRSQLRKAIRKVIVKGNLDYRTLTDKPQTEHEGKPDATNDSGPYNLSAENLKIIAQGNKSLFPIFAYSSVANSFDEMETNSVQHNNNSDAESILVTFEGKTIDVKKLRQEVDEHKRVRITMDANLNVMRSTLNEAKNQVTHLRKTNEALKEELFRTKESLKKQESAGKTNVDDLEVFRRASERFYERVQHLIKPPSKDKESNLSNKKDNTTSLGKGPESGNETNI